MFKSLRFKIVAALVFINITSFIAMNLINYETLNKQMNKQLISQSITNLKSTVSNLNTMLELRMKESELIIHSIPDRLQSTDQRLAFLREEVPLANLPTKHIGIAEKGSDMRLLNGTLLPFDGNPAFERAMKGNTSYTDIQLDQNGFPVIWLMIPLYDATNDISGVVGLAFDSTKLLSEQLQLKSNMSDYKESSIILIDAEANLLYHPDASLILKRNYMRDEPNLSDMGERLKTRLEGYREEEIFGRVLKTFYVRVPGTDWFAVFVVSKSEFVAPLRHSMWMNMGLIALTEIVLGAFLYFIMQRSVLNRLKQVVEVTKYVAAGNFYPPPLRIQSRDEIGILASSVNGMIDNLQDLFEPFQAFIRHNQYAMIVTDSQFVITSYNKRAEEMLGYTEREVMGRKSLLLWHDHDQIVERSNYYSEKLKRHVPPDESALFVLSHKGFLPDWEWIWIDRKGTRMLVTLNPSVMRHPDGTTKGYVLIARDISEIKQAVATNTRLLEIIESAHDTIASFDMRGHIFYLNQAGHAFLGIDSLTEQNNLLSQYMPIPTTVRFADGLTEAQKKGYWQSEIEIMGAAGRMQTASITVVAHLTDDDRSTYFSTIVRDISDLKETQRQLVKAKDEADDANEAKSSFLARMSHEIRTPLNGIIGLTYLLQRSELTEIQADYLRQVSDSSQNLLRILNDILDFSKLEADKLSLERVPFRIEDSVQRLSGIFSVLLGPKPVDFIISVDRELPDWIIGDPTRLEQVLLNLGSNAIKFTNRGLIQLSIDLIQVRDGYARIRFVVKDTGIGMTEQQRKQLFLPFVQADEKTSRKYGGTGLGLVISHTLIERMGGQITADSKYQVGSKFQFDLSFEVDNKHAASYKPQFAGLNVIVLEDQVQVAEHWRDLLYSLGCDVITLSTWTQASSLIHESKWDLMIVDMEAGDMHGEETWMDWKTQLNAHGLKVISHTTLLGRDALQQLPDEFKPAVVMVKPFSSLHVQQALQAVVSSYEEAKLRDEVIVTPPAPIRSRSDSTGQEPLRIMVVDDQIINRLVVKQLLEQQGFEVDQMESGLNAVTALELLRTDLILMDLHMPEMDGIEATKHIRKFYDAERLPIVALTADVTKEQHARCYAAGMNDIMTKPIEPDHLFAVLRRWLPVSDSVIAPLRTEQLDSWPETPGLHIKQALRRLDGKSALYLQLLDKFMKQYSDTEDKLAELLKSGNKRDAIRLVHSLSGAAGHLGASNIQETATAMENALRDEGDWEILKQDLFQSIQIVMGTISSLILQKRS
ncbi:response regulator [Cohnella lupini]|uniref:Circadian input-output histidine kinase CikA n=1 Tax=Cohnella lupini TaxID=1294267 RepID=A0A3D9HZ38_9BACL|nr:response regulator [Cohnella lupini]RED54695.1 PAS domain S-box-containing protein [Cohnella lupini]